MKNTSPAHAVFALFSVTPAATHRDLQGPYGQLLAGFILPSDLDDRLRVYVQALHHVLVGMPTDTPQDRLTSDLLADLRQALLVRSEFRVQAMFDVVTKYLG